MSVLVARFSMISVSVTDGAEHLTVALSGILATMPVQLAQKPSTILFRVVWAGDESGKLEESGRGPGSSLNFVGGRYSLNPNDLRSSCHSVLSPGTLIYGTDSTTLFLRWRH